MLKLLSLKKQQEEQAAAAAAAAAAGGEGGGSTAAAAASSSSSSGSKQVISAARRRLQADLSNPAIGENKWCQLRVTSPDDICHFTVTIAPDEGFWRGGKFEFRFDVGEDYPFSPPKVLCVTKIYHPNIDTEGKVCLNILREDWKPVLDINAIITGLLFLFLEPNPDDPLNKEAANLLATNKAAFAQNVIRVMRGYR